MDSVCKTTAHFHRDNAAGSRSLLLSSLSRNHPHLGHARAGCPHGNWLPHHACTKLRKASLGYISKRGLVHCLRYLATLSLRIPLRCASRLKNLKALKVALLCGRPATQTEQRCTKKKGYLHCLRPFLQGLESWGTPFCAFSIRISTADSFKQNSNGLYAYPTFEGPATCIDLSLP